MQPTKSKNKTKTLLLVGPKPPPIGGSGLTVQAIIDELAAKYPGIRLTLINTSPYRDPRKKLTGFNFEKVLRMAMIVPKYIWEVGRSDTVVVLANNLFAFAAVPVMILFARLFRKPFYLKPVGGDLDLYLEELPKPLRAYLLAILRAADGILVQTKMLQASLIAYGCQKALYLPGMRTVPAVTRPKKSESGELRLIFLAHIMRPKGPLVLLEALQILAKSGDVQVSCDFYGPVHDELHDDFYKQLAMTPSAQHCGMAEPGSGASLIAAYDALVLPTFFVSEGHPGVLIEAMHVGVPVISTWHRAVPELVTDGENGLLVPPHDAPALADAIRKMAQTPGLREKMGRAHLLRGEEFITEKVVAQMLEMVFPAEVE
jgi:glycosyltransferase involved in cell wall biosynthesis